MNGGVTGTPMRTTMMKTWSRFLPNHELKAQNSDALAKSICMSFQFPPLGPRLAQSELSTYYFHIRRLGN